MSQEISYQIFATSATFFVPLILILLLYWRIFLTARWPDISLWYWHYMFILFQHITYQWPPKPSLLQLNGYMVFVYWGHRLMLCKGPNITSLWGSRYINQFLMIDNIRPWSRQRLRKRLAVKSCLPRPESSMVTDNCTTSDHANVGTTRLVSNVWRCEETLFCCSILAAKESRNLFKCHSRSFWTLLNIAYKYACVHLH